MECVGLRYQEGRGRARKLAHLFMCVCVNALAPTIMSAQSHRREEEIEGEEDIGNAPTVAVEENSRRAFSKSPDSNPESRGACRWERQGPSPFGETPTPQFTT
ncbi:hypothetical protein MRX96_049630 [Rhipicephalus microplus]